MSDELMDALARHTLVLLIGADLPREITGIPSRADLALALARRHGVDSSLSLAEVAQRIGQGGNRYTFTASILEALDGAARTPQEFHLRVAKLVQDHGIETVMTTAYDNLLELAFQQSGMGINRVVRASDVSFVDPARPTLIKLYGDAQQRDTLVITDRDHLDLLRDRDREDVLDEARRAFRRNTVYIVGHDLSDPDFRFLFDQVAESRFARLAYAVWPGLLPAEVQMWRDRGIVILDSDPLDLLMSAAQAPASGQPAAIAAVERPVTASSSDASAWEAQSLRELLTASLSDLEVTTLCFDHFPEVYENLGTGMGKGVKIQQLIEYCLRHGRVQDLLNEVRRLNPTQYARLATQEHRGDSGGQVRDLPVQGMGQGAGEEGRTGKGEGKDVAAVAPTYGTGRRWAVLIGVDMYEDVTNYGQLHVCVKDVEATRERLLAGSFEAARIRLLTDHTSLTPTRANILMTLKAVAENTEPDDLLLLYYSGHGDQEGNESYLVARDGRRLVLSDTGVSISRIKQIISDAPARAKVILLDACHSGADIGGKGPRPMSAEFIRRVFEEAEGMAVLASCKQGQLSYEWQESERSVFTHFMLEALAGDADQDGKGFVTVQDASRHVVDGVKLWASQHNVVQTPTLQYAVVGDIVLSRHAALGTGG